MASTVTIEGAIVGDLPAEEACTTENCLEEHESSDGEIMDLSDDGDGGSIDVTGVEDVECPTGDPPLLVGVDGGSEP